jgi:hypothetical protein
MGGGSGTDGMAVAKGLLIVSTTGGNLAFRYGQSVAEVSTALPRAGSYLKATRIA